MIYLLLFTAMIITIENLTNATDREAWEMLFQVIHNEP